MRHFALLIAALGMLTAVPAVADGLPTALGTCVRTTVSFVGQRLTNGENGPPMPGSGSAIGFANGGYQVSYSEVTAVNQAEVNDPVVICLVRIPPQCPPGDTRGRVYATVDLRTMLLWVLPDSEHSCGGA